MRRGPCQRDELLWKQRYTVPLTPRGSEIRKALKGPINGAQKDTEGRGGHSGQREQQNAGGRDVLERPRVAGSGTERVLGGGRSSLEERLRGSWTDIWQG